MSIVRGFNGRMTLRQPLDCGYRSIQRVCFQWKQLFYRWPTRWVIVCVNLVSTGNKDLIDVYYSRCLTAGWLLGNRWVAATGRFSGFVSTGNSFLSMAHVGLLPELILFPVETTFLSKPKVVFACVDLFSIGNNFLLDSPRWFIVCVNLVSTGNKDLIDVYYSRCLTAGWLLGNRWVAATGRFSGFVSTGNSFFIDSPRLLIACADLVSIGNKLVS